MLDLVHACNNKDGDALKNLIAMVESTTAQAEWTVGWRSTFERTLKPPSPQKVAKIEHVRAVANKTNQERYPGSKPILERPLPLSEIKGGNRRVPNLVTAQGVPFLRYSKPQPISLNRVIRQRLQWNERNWGQKILLEKQILMAEYEDEWDELLRRDHGIVDKETNNAFGKPVEPSWMDEFHNTEKTIIEAIRAKDAKQLEMGKKMWEIVKKERELKRQEKIERRAARKELRAPAQDAGEAPRPEA